MPGPSRSSCRRGVVSVTGILRRRWWYERAKRALRLSSAPFWDAWKKGKHTEKTRGLTNHRRINGLQHREYDSICDCIAGRTTLTAPCGSSSVTRTCSECVTRQPGSSACLGPMLYPLFSSSPFASEVDRIMLFRVCMPFREPNAA